MGLVRRLFFLALVCDSVSAETSNLFFDRVAEGLVRCSTVAAGTIGHQEVQQRQQRFDHLYGPGVFASDPEFRSFLVFLDLVLATYRQVEMKDSLLEISDGAGATRAIHLLENFEADFLLVSNYLERLKSRLPKLQDAFLDLQKFTHEELKDWKREKQLILDLGEQGASGLDRTKEKARSWARVQGTLAKMRGYYSEFQLSLRIPRVERAGFYLAEDVAEYMKSLGQSAPEGKKALQRLTDFMETLDPQLGAIVDQLQEELAPVDPNDPIDTPHRARIRYLLTKEMDLETRAEDGSLIWYEPKNYNGIFTSKDFRGPRGESLRKQVKVSVILRQIVMALFPGRRIRLELHFLNGIAAHPKSRFEALFAEMKEKDLSVVGEAPDSPN